MTDSLVWLLLLPLAWATLAFVLGPGRGAWLAIAGLAAQFALAVDLARKAAAGGVSAHVVGGWGAPLGIDLAADGLSAAIEQRMTGTTRDAWRAWLTWRPR